MSVNLPTVHVPRPDGGYELRPLQPSDVLGWIRDGEPLLSDLLTIIHNAIAVYNSQGKTNKIDLQVTAIEAAADGAEMAKVGP
jgi:hypothetical protein